jgi:hypothetical protein
VGQQRGLGLAVETEGGDAVVHGLVQVAVPRADDAQIDVRLCGAHGALVEPSGRV